MLQQPVDTVYPFRYLLQRAADIAQAQEMLRAAGQTEYGSRHELDALQAQPLPEQDGVHGVRDLHPEKHAACLLRIWQRQVPRIQDRLRHAAALGRILCNQPLQMHCIEPALKIQRQHLLQEHRACNIGIELCKDQPFFKPARNEQIAEAQPRHERLGKRVQVQHGIAAVADYAHAQNSDCLVIVDNAFATPLLVQPLKQSADVVVHSATKYLNGHGDMVAGFSVARKEIMDKIRMVGLKDITGAVLGSQEAFLILRGLKTLKVRMDAVCANTQKVVDFLAGSKYVQKVFYPGLENHSDHAVAVREMTQFGGVASFEMGSFEEAKKVLNHVHLCALAVSLGDCETLIQHPASMTHSMCTKEEIEAADFSDRLIRLAVGLEGPDDIIADLQQAFEAAQN